MQDRRRAPRVRVGLSLAQIVDGVTHSCVTTSLSERGLFLERGGLPIARRTNVVQLELALPGVKETLWAKAKVVYDAFDAFGHGSAVEFLEMASAHRRALHEFVGSQTELVA